VGPRIEHDPGVPRPHDQIAGLRGLDLSKAHVPGVQIERTRVCIRKTSGRVNLMNQMRAILSAWRRLIVLSRGLDDRPAILRAHQPHGRVRLLGGLRLVRKRRRRRDTAQPYKTTRRDQFADRTAAKFVLRFPHPWITRVSSERNRLS
jgi:hypothetical protein